MELESRVPEGPALQPHRSPVHHVGGRGAEELTLAGVPDPLPTLQRRFGHPSFRPGQEEIVRAVLEGSDVLAVMPTGAGKSLCYQLPAVLLPGLTLVVSPLIALMKDQVDELARKGLPAAALHSLLTSSERRDAMTAARSGSLRLLYVSPERFGSEAFDRLLGELRVSRFAVDEAHCVSEWGHDFRPDYRLLAAAAQRCRRADGAAGRPPIVAFTATATPEVREDIASLLSLSEPRVFVAGFDRPNIVLEVRRVSGEADKLRNLKELVAGRRALVYTATRKAAERAALALDAAGLPAEAYHAGLDEETRTEVQDAFAAGRLPIVCATNAFGMGIDRPDVEAVVHYEVPGSLEAYYQEIGRAGRDGRTAQATLLWSYADVKTREFLIEKEDDEGDARWQRAPQDPVQRDKKRELDRKKLRRIVEYADSAGCLRATLLRYFGESVAFARCGGCGNCRRAKTLGAEELLTLRKVLSGVARGGERWGRRKVAAMLAGDLEGLPDSLTTLSTTGILSMMGQKRVELWLEAARGAGLLAATDDVYRVLTLTRLGRDVMAGRVAEVEITLPEERKAQSPKREKRSKAPAADRLRPPDESLLAALRDWRRREATARGLPPYVVFHDKTLSLLASLKPTTREALARVPGIGPAKLELYGPDLLEMLGK